MLTRFFVCGFVNKIAADKNYARHVMVADENFFVTVLKNSPMCHTHENRNLVHVQFDQWEQDKETKDDAAADAAAAAAAALGRGRPRRNAAKCLMPNPDHCGRSPTINTLETLPALQLSEKPFARKFDADIDADVLDAIDAMRRDEESGKEGDGDGGSGSRRAYGNESGSGDGGAGGLVFRDVRIAIETSTGGGGGGGPSRLCVHVPASSMDPAFVGRCGKGYESDEIDDDHDGKDGEEESNDGADDDEAARSLDVGPCSMDGALAVEHGRPMRLEAGRFSRPFCPVRSRGAGLCLDLEGEKVEAGTPMIAYGCGVKWNQLFTFGRAPGSGRSKSGGSGGSSGSASAVTSTSGDDDDDDDQDDQDDQDENDREREGHVFINVPFIAHQSKRLCLQADALRDGARVRVADCAPDEPRQRFVFLLSPQARRRRAGKDEL